MTHFCYNSVVRGYHVYKEVLEASHGELLNCERETGNTFDPFTVCVKKHDDIVGPRAKKNFCHTFAVLGAWWENTIFEVIFNFQGRKSFLGGLIFVEKGIPRKSRKFVHLENFYAYGI